MTTVRHRGPSAFLISLFALVPFTALQAQECLGFHRVRAVTSYELTAHRQPASTGLGLGVSRGAVFGLVEVATDPVTERQLLNTKRFGTTLGIQRGTARGTVCAGAKYRQDELEAAPSVRSVAVGVMLAYGYRIIDGKRPVVLFGQGQMESRRDELTGEFARELGQSTGSGVRVGAAYRYTEWVGVRGFLDVHAEGPAAGASVSISPRRR